jgi:hypothetical protein
MQLDTEQPCLDVVVHQPLICDEPHSNFDLDVEVHWPLICDGPHPNSDLGVEAHQPLFYDELHSNFASKTTTNLPSSI